MTLFFLLLLAIVQGITEFLPVSSSAHLILMPHVFGMPDQGYEIDIAVHAGSLFAVMIFFRAEIARIFIGIGDALRGKWLSYNLQLLFLLIVATIPVVLAGFALEITGIIDRLRNPLIIALAMIIFGIVLYFTDKRGGSEKEFEDWNYRDAIIFGLWQAIALIPGTSRSGATVTASRILGYERHDGAKIAMLMSIPTITAGALLLIAKIATADEPTALGGNALIAVIASFIASLAALRLMMRFLRRSDYTPYVIYRILLGIVLIAVFV